MGQGQNRDFDAAAATWDEKPRRVKLANDIADAILEQIPLRPEMDAIDFGCGTGLLALRVQPFVRSITGVDSSTGMLEILREKTRKKGLTNVNTLHLYIEKGDKLQGPYHLAVSAMTLHHIRSVELLLDQFFRILLPGGRLRSLTSTSTEGDFTTTTLACTITGLTGRTWFSGFARQDSKMFAR